MSAAGVALTSCYLAVPRARAGPLRWNWGGAILIVGRGQKDGQAAADAVRTADATSADFPAGDLATHDSPKPRALDPAEAAKL